MAIYHFYTHIFHINFSSKMPIFLVTFVLITMSFFFFTSLPCLNAYLSTPSPVILLDYNLRVMNDNLYLLFRTYTGQSLYFKKTVTQRMSLELFSGHIVVNISFIIICCVNDIFLVLSLNGSFGRTNKHRIIIYFIARVVRLIIRT